MVGQLAGEWWVFVVLGLCAGVISGMLGLGSGVIIVPALVFLCGFGQKSAQGTALAVMVPMALVGAVRYWRNPQVELSGLVIVVIAFGAVAGAVVGTELAARLPAGTLRRLFALCLLIVAVKMLIGSSRPTVTQHEMGLSERVDTKVTEPAAIDDTTAKR